MRGGLGAFARVRDSGTLSATINEMGCGASKAPAPRDEEMDGTKTHDRGGVTFKYKPVPATGTTPRSKEADSLDVSLEMDDDD